MSEKALIQKSNMWIKSMRNLFLGLMIVGLFLVAGCETIITTTPTDPTLPTDPTTPTTPTDPITPTDPTMPTTPTDPTTPTTGSSTAGVLCNIDVSDDTPTSVVFTSTYAWNCSDAERSITGNGVPDHEVGTFDRNPIAEQNISQSFPLSPVLTDTATELGGPRGILAYALNGVKFDPGTAGTCNDSGDACNPAGGTGTWSQEALGINSFNFGEDFNNAHVQPGGLYHYHGIPESYLTKLSGGQAKMTLIGWATDGFPIYARYGYSDATDAGSDIKVITGSYQTKTIPDENRPSTDLYAMGMFSQDWEYVSGFGDLDECNGRTGVTPEFPNGIYHYFATDTYPFMTRCVKGEITAGDNRPPRPNATAVSGQ